MLPIPTRKPRRPLQADQPVEHIVVQPIAPPTLLSSSDAEQTGDPLSKSTRGRRSAQSAATARLRLLIWLVPLVAYIYFIPRGISWNSDSHLALTYALVDHHTAIIDNYSKDLGDRAYYHGHYYTEKAPGLSLLAVPAYALLHLVLAAPFFGPLLFITRYLLTIALLAVPSSLFTALLWRRWRQEAVAARMTQVSSDATRITGAANGGPSSPQQSHSRSHGVSPITAATILAGAAALCGLAFPYSTIFFSHQLVAILLFSAFLVLAGRVDVSLIHAGHHASSLTGKAQDRIGQDQRAAALAGLLCGIATATEYPAALIGCVLGAAWLWRPGGWRWAARWATSWPFPVLALLGASPALIYNTIVFGGPLRQGYAHLAGAPQFIKGMAQGIEGISTPSLDALWGVTFGLYRGLLPLCPWLLLALPGLWWMLRRNTSAQATVMPLYGTQDGRYTYHWRWRASVCLAVVVVYLLFNASYYFWTGGYSIGPRHFVPALYFLAYPVLFALLQRGWLLLALPLLLYSLVTMVVSTATGPLFPLTPDEPVYGWAWPNLLAGHVQNNWANFAGLHGLSSVVPLALFLAGSIGLAIRALGRVE